MQKIYQVKLKVKEQHRLRRLTQSGSEKARKLNRCRILLLAHEGKTDQGISEVLGISLTTVARIRQRYYRQGLEVALGERARPGAPKKFEGKAQAKITAIACSQPPEGRGRWTLRLLADQLVELELVDEISHQSVKNILKKTNLSLT